MIRTTTFARDRVRMQACLTASPAGPGAVLRSCPPPSAAGRWLLLYFATHGARPHRAATTLARPRPPAYRDVRQPSGQGDPRSEVKGEGSAPPGPIPEDMSGGGRPGPRARERLARATPHARRPSTGTRCTRKPAPRQARPAQQRPARAGPGLRSAGSPRRSAPPPRRASPSAAVRRGPGRRGGGRRGPGGAAAALPRPRRARA